MTIGVAQLGYLGFEVRDLAAWEAFATQVLGLLIVDRQEEGAFSLRMDTYRQRFFITPGPADDLSVLGWQVADEEMLDALTARLKGAGITVTGGTPEETAARHVRRLVKYTDPGGLPSELFVGPEMAVSSRAPSLPFQSPVVHSGFVADEQGLGHVVIAARNQRESQDFYCDLLGFRLSDRIVADVHGYKADLVFLHTNSRHHSLAIGEQQRKRIHHFMIEARAMDEVGLAFDRALKAGVRIMQTLGRHPNDRMFSFYARTPSGFQFEFGWGGRRVDDATWEPSIYDHISEWGHHPPQFLVPTK